LSTAAQGSIEHHLDPVLILVRILVFRALSIHSEPRAQKSFVAGAPVRGKSLAAVFFNGQFLRLRSTCRIGTRIRM